MLIGGCDRRMQIGILMKMKELSSSSLVRIIWGMVVTTGQGTQKLFCSDCLADKATSPELKRKGQHLQCKEHTWGASTHMRRFDTHAQPRSEGSAELVCSAPATLP